MFSAVTLRVWLSFAVIAGAMLVLLGSASAQPPPAASSIDAREAARLFALETGVTTGPINGEPPAVEVFHDGRLVGYAFSTRAVAASVGYSGRPLDIHVGLRLDGGIAGTRLVAQEEPILVIGIKPSDLEEFVKSLAGLDIRQVLRRQPAKEGAPDHVAGATVSSTVMKDAVLRSARAVAHARGLFGAPADRARLDRSGFAPKSWAQLMDDGAITRRRLSRAEVAHVLGTKDPGSDTTFIEIYATLITPPMIGQNLLGQRDFERAMAQLPLDGQLILIAASGLYSFKGTAWRTTGLFERVQLVQGTRTLRLRREHHENVERIVAGGAPDLREIGLFRLPAEFQLDPSEPWRIDLVVEQDVDGRRRSAIFPVEYKLPDSLLVHPARPDGVGAAGAPPAEPAIGVPRTVTPSGQAVEPPQSGPQPRPALLPSLPPAASASEQVQAPQAEPELWVGIWRSRKLAIGTLVALLASLTVILFSHDALTRRLGAYRVTRLAFLATTLAFLGLLAGAQLSVVHVITFVHALLSGFRWELFLLDPLVFILWGFVALVLLFWGRGVFCGWLCPFGALQELLNEGARKLGIRQIEVPWTLHERLWPIKYIAFLLILGASFQSMTVAFRMAEIEPFKTAVSLKFMRDWPFVLYASALLVAGLFIERFFCRYLCPLGAALAIPARLRLFEWLKRRQQCGRECRICATRCTVQAINPLGQIVPNECIYCLQCQANYHDATTCLPLKQRAARRAGTLGLSPAEAGEDGRR